MMLGLPRSYGRFLAAILQASVTCALATATAGLSHSGAETLIVGWLYSWLASRALMAPVVLVLAPLIRRLALLLTASEDLA